MSKLRIYNKYRVSGRGKLDLAKINPDDTTLYKDKKQAQKSMSENLEKLSRLQYLLFAESKRAMLIILQGMDSAGKDGTVRHVMGPLNPASCRVTSFKTPNEQELAHDYLWRIHKHVPRKGEIGIFNRSHYEDVLIVRVQKLVPKDVWEKRYKQINDFERMLSENGVHILKFFLHISKDEQLERLKARLDKPHKQWKADPADFEQRKFWDSYQKAYTDVIRKCSTSYAPWFVIPADKKWFRNMVVSEILVEYMTKLHMKFPKSKYDLSEIKKNVSLLK